MKSFLSLLLLAATAQSHYTFTKLVINGKPEEAEWSVTRMTKNAQSKSGVENANSGDIRCYQSRNAGKIASVPAGATIHYVSSQQINHPGPTQYYLAKVPAGQSASTWDGSGAVWFKISTTMPKYDSRQQLVWPNQNEYTTAPAVIPSSVPSGEYLLRVEQIALHMAMQANKAQFYLSCSQISITGGGNGKPGPMVSLPGAYKANDPGLLVNLQAIKPEAYIPPGPAVWTG